MGEYDERSYFVKKVRTSVYRRIYASGKNVWMVRWWDASSCKWRSLKGGKTEDEAKDAERIVSDDLRRGVSPVTWLTESKAETVSELIDLFYQSPQFQSSSESWRRIMRYHLDGHIKAKLGTLHFSELTRDKLYAFYFDLKNQRGLCHSSIQKYHLKLCFLGDIHVERHPDKANVPRQLKDFKKRFPAQAPRREINFLTPEEIEKILAELKKSTSDIAYPFTKLLVHTGMRREEARNLKWTDIDFESGFFHIRKSKNGKSRSVPIEPGAAEVLAGMPRISEFVFVHKDGSRPDKYSLRRPFQRAAKRIGIDKRVDLHSLRHSYGSNKVRAGWGLKKVSMLLGHSDISLTARVYTHLLDGDLKVQDDFRFDNLPQKQNSVDTGGIVREIKKPSVKMDSTTIMAMIQMLQQQLLEQNMAIEAVPHVLPNNSENVRKTQNAVTKSVEMTAFCNAGVTRTKKGPRNNTADLS
ncbi:MAG: hypothetical protein A2583_12470, partial [Bdellovibrionales bacterium RIFOXYD1_FULL_53_11]